MNINQTIKSDLSLIQKELGSELVETKIFGSCVTEHPNMARDIDVALFVKNPNIKLLRKRLSKLDTTVPIAKKRIQLSYGGDIKPDEPRVHFDIVILESGNPLKEFMDKNEGRLVNPERVFS